MTPDGARAGLHPLSARELLDYWDWAQAQAIARRALGLLAAAFPAAAAEDLERLSLGSRDRALLAVRESLFGRPLPALADCPSCRGAVRLDLDTAELRGGAGTVLEPPAEPRTHVAGDVEVRWRLPEARDLLALEEAGDVAGARERLLRSTIVEARRGEDRLTADELPEPVLAEVLALMDRADPHTRVRFDLTCPACGHRWLSPFDVAGYVWGEVTALARRLLYEVHVLASAYGWREAEVLGMSARRRWAYLELLGR